jgi:hypothetical protein
MVNDIPLYTGKLPDYAGWPRDIIRTGKTAREVA